MISQPNNPQPVAFNINNMHGNNYVNHAVGLPTQAATVTKCAQVGDVLAPMSPLWEAQKNAIGPISISSMTLNNHMGFNEVEGTNSCNKSLTTSPEDHHLMNDTHSPNKTPAPT